MYSHFGGKWCCLYNGPFWSVATVEQGAAKHLGKTTWAIPDVSYIIKVVMCTNIIILLLYRLVSTFQVCLHAKYRRILPQGSSQTLQRFRSAHNGYYVVAIETIDRKIQYDPYRSTYWTKHPKYCLMCGGG